MSEYEDTIRLLRATVLQVTDKPLPDMSFDTPIRDLGIDSISVAEIVTRIEDKLEIQIAVSEWLRARTLGEFISTIEQARNARG